MSYDYGTKQLEINNPFKIEGIVIAIRGGILLLLGVYLLFVIRHQLIGKVHVEIWEQLTCGLTLLTFGIGALSRGLLRTFKFYVGRGVPQNLSPAAEIRKQKPANNSEDQASTRNTGRGTGPCVYSIDKLKEMLFKRTNITYTEPKTWLARLLHTLIERLLYLPTPLRNIAQALFESAALTLSLCILYGLAIFSGSTGLTNFTATNSGQWLGMIYVLAIFYTWWRLRPNEKLLSESRFRELPAERLRVWIAFSILVPAVLEFISSKWHIPALTINPYTWLFTILALSVLTVAAGAAITVLRLPQGIVKTDVSEFWDHLNAILQPNDVFRTFEKTLADFRFMEIPNRVYERDDPELNSDNKGSYTGEFVQEVQPIPTEHETGRLFVILRHAIYIVGQILLLAAAIWLFIVVRYYMPSNTHVMLNATLGISILSLFGSILSHIANAYYAEIFFSSYLVSLKLDGTYHIKGVEFNPTALAMGSTGAVESRMTPLVLASKIESSTFAVSGTRNLEQPRYILQMEHAQDFLDAIMNDVKQYVTQLHPSPPHRVIESNTTKPMHGEDDNVVNLPSKTEVIQE